MSFLRITLLQLTAVSDDDTENLNKADWACRVAKDRGADMALFPQIWNIGYAPPFPEAWDDPWRPDKEAERQAWRERAIDERDPYLQHFSDLAHELDLAIAITYLERWPHAPGTHSC